MSGAREWKIGPHEIDLEPPDLLRLRYQGHLTLAQAADLVALYRELALTRPLYAIGDMSAAEPLEPEVQRYLGDHIRPEWFRLSVYFGARLVHKALIKGIVMAAQLSASEPPPTAELLASIHYTATREEAERLLRELRARLPAQEAGW